MNSKSVLSGRSLMMLLLFIAGSFSAYPLLAQKKSDIEITATDITTVKDFHSSAATVWGVKLGMGMDEAKKLIASKNFLTIEKDPTNDRRLYVYEKKAAGDTGRTLLGYFKWLHGPDTGLKEIVLFPAFAKYMKGESKSLLTGACEDPNSKVCTSFLGEPSLREVESDIPSINYKEERLYYSKRMLLIEKMQQKGNTTYNLVLYQP